MIPPFDEHGYLPPGIHRATLEEVTERFGTGSEDRIAQMESLRWAVELAKRIGAKRFIINGSFVTAKTHPIDVDCVILLTNPTGSLEEQELATNTAFVSAAIVRESELEEFVEVIFASDKAFVPKGMGELIW